MKTPKRSVGGKIAEANLDKATKMTKKQMMTDLLSAKSLHDDRRVRADDVFERIQFPAQVEDHEGWETMQGFGTELHNNVWSKVVYLQNENDPDGPTTRHTFEVTFRANSCVPVAAFLDDISLPLPR